MLLVSVKKNYVWMVGTELIPKRRTFCEEVLSTEVFHIDVRFLRSLSSKYMEDLELMLTS